MKKSGKGKILFFIICMACVVFLAGNCIYGLRVRGEDVPKDPIQGISSGSSMVGYMGTGYLLQDAESLTDQEYQEEFEPEILEPETEPDNEEKSEEETETKEESPDTEASHESPEEDFPQTAEDDSGGEPTEGNEDPNEVFYEEETPEEGTDVRDTADDDSIQQGAETPGEPVQDPNEGKYPEIASDLAEEETVNADYRTFFVQATDYRGQYIPASGLEVYGNGEKLYSISNSNHMVGYRLDPLVQENRISIQATDSEGRSTTVLYTIYRGEDTEAEVIGSIRFSLEAGTLGLGYLLGPASVEIHEGEQLSLVICRVLEDNGFTVDYDGDLTSGFYLRNVARGGITQGFSIPEELAQKLEEANCSLETYWQDSLGEFDFTKYSGWMYFVNGEYMSSGISTYFPADGDEVRVRFTLYAGADLGHGTNGVTWGDW